MIAALYVNYILCLYKLLRSTWQLIVRYFVKWKITKFYELYIVKISKYWIGKCLVIKEPSRQKKYSKKYYHFPSFAIQINYMNSKALINVTKRRLKDIIIGVRNGWSGGIWSFGPGEDGNVWKSCDALSLTVRRWVQLPPRFMPSRRCVCQVWRFGFYARPGHVNALFYDQGLVVLGMSLHYMS